MKTLQKTINRKRRHGRIRKIISGTPARPRLVIYKSLNNHYAQIIDDTQGVTLVSTSDLKDKGKAKKMESAKKVGLKIAELAKEKKITVCVFDRCGFNYHGRVKAIADGAREGGLQF